MPTNRLPHVARFFKWVLLLNNLGYKCVQNRRIGAVYVLLVVEHRELLPSTRAVTLSISDSKSPVAQTISGPFGTLDIISYIYYLG
jgi:hypothetical protein